MEEQGYPNVPNVREKCQNPCCVFNINVMAPDGTMYQFLIRKTTRLMKLIKLYCLMLGLDLSRLTFMFEGHVIREHDTALSIGMTHGDVIVHDQMFLVYRRERLKIQ